jgi:hypothetical protein
MTRNATLGAPAARILQRMRCKKAYGVIRLAPVTFHSAEMLMFAHVTFFHGWSSRIKCSFCSALLENVTSDARAE